MKKYQKTIKTKKYYFNDLEILLKNFNSDIRMENIVKTYRYHCKIEDIIKGKNNKIFYSTLAPISISFSG